MTTTIWQKIPGIGRRAKDNKCKIRTTAKGRTPTDRFSLMEDANRSLHHYMTQDRDHLGDFLLSFSCDSIEKMVMLLNTRMSVASPSDAYSDYTPLGYAIVQNDPKGVDILLRFGACAQSAPCTSVDNTTTVLSPLHLALTYHCQPAIVDVLLDHGATIVNIERQDSASLIGFIAKCRSKSTASLLISNCTCLETTDVDKRTLLHLATINCNGAVVSSVIDTRLVDVDRVDAMGKTALMYAAERNSSVVVQLLLDGGATVDLTDAWGRTALHFASRRAGVKTVQMLLSSGADIRIGDLRGLTPLTYAFSHDKILHAQAPKENEEDLINCLVESTRTPVSLKERDFIHVAFVMARTCESETAIVNLLASNREHAAKRNSNGQTLLHVAAEFGNHAAVEWFIENSVLDSNIPDAIGWLPLHYAAKGGNSETFFYLLDQHGADVNSATPSGWTPLWIAARNGWTDLACDVIRWGCDVDQTLTVTSLRQASSHFSLPLSLFDPKAQRDSPLHYAKGGSRLLTLAEYSQQCQFDELSRLLVDRHNVDSLSNRDHQNANAKDRKTVKRWRVSGKEQPGCRPCCKQ